MEARLAGDEQRVRELCAELGWEVPEGQVGKNADTPRVVRRTGRTDRSGFPGGDVMITPAWQSRDPSLACTADGTLWLVADDVSSSGNYLDIYHSDNGGYSWMYDYSIQAGADLSNPSLAIAEGEENRLLVAYEYGQGTPDAAIYLHYNDLGSGTGIEVLVESSPLGVFKPRICTDQSVYYNWWPYLTYVRGGLNKQDRYDLMMTRSYDYGASWHTPTVLETDVAGDTRPDIDYGTPGLFIVYTRDVPGNLNDVYLLRSVDLGGSFDPELALVSAAYNETDPGVAVATGDLGVVVTFTREYAVGNHDVEAMFSLDGGDAWSLSYLPWTPNRENLADVVSSPGSELFHAAFWSEHDVHYTWSNYATPGSWSAVETLNDSGAAAIYSRPTVAAALGRDPEGCAAWTDTRIEFQYNVYFNATYKLGEYLAIIAHAGLTEAVEPLVDWKQQLGHTVSVVDLGTIYAAYPTVDDAEAIWSYLRDRQADLKYVLLVGDVDLLPMRLLYPDGDPAYPPTDPRHHTGLAYGTDYYYAELTTINWDPDGDNRWGEFFDDGLDIVPEVYVGRLPFNDAAPVQAICSNIVSFEQDTGAWKRNALLAHGFLNQPEDAETPACDMAAGADYLRLNLMQPHGWSTVTLYERIGLGQSPFSCDAGLSQYTYGYHCDILDFGVVNCAAHGNGLKFEALRWLNDYDGTGYCDQPAEVGKNTFSQQSEIPAHPTRALVFLNGCSTAPLFGTDDNFLDSPMRSRYLIRTPVNPLAVKDYLLFGAAGVIGSSAGSKGLAGWTTPNDGNSLSFNYYFYYHLIEEGLPVGEAIQRAQHTYAQIHGLQREMRVFNYFGDPSLVLPGVPVAKQGEQAGKRLPGHLTRSAALALAGDWRRTAGDAAAVPVSSGTKTRNDADIWKQCAELPDCFVITSLAEAGSGGPVYGTGVMTVGDEGTIGVIFASSDGWDPWIVIPIEWMPSARKIFHTLDGSLLLGGMMGTPDDPHGVVLRLPPGAQDWVLVADIPGTVVTDFCQDLGGTLWLATGLDAKIYRSADDGASWSHWVTISGQEHFNSLMQASSGKYIATLNNYDHLSIVESEDAEIWFPVTGLAGIKSAYTVVELDGHLYAGVREATQGRVFRSDDLSGENWSALPPFPAEAGGRAVRSLAVDAEGRLLAGLSVDQCASTTWVYSLDPVEMVWRMFAGGIELADRVTTILPVSGHVFAGTGSINGNLYRCEGPIISPVPGDMVRPYLFMLDQNYPNPFNPTTTIAFMLPREETVRLDIYDVSGRMVRRLVDGSTKTAGPHQVTWDGRDDHGRSVPAGIYVYRLVAGRLIESRRMVLVK